MGQVISHNPAAPAGLVVGHSVFPLAEDHGSYPNDHVVELCDFGGISRQLARQYLLQHDGNLQRAKEALLCTMKFDTPQSNQHVILVPSDQCVESKLKKSLSNLNMVSRSFETFSVDVRVGAQLNRARCVFDFGRH